MLEVVMRMSQEVQTQSLELLNKHYLCRLEGETRVIPVLQKFEYESPKFRDTLLDRVDELEGSLSEDLVGNSWDDVTLGQLDESSW